MRPAVRLSSCLALALAVVACGGPSTPPGPPPGSGKPTAAPAKPATPAAPPAAKPAAPEPLVASPAVVAAAAAPALTSSAPKYEAKGRRDPFESLEARLGSERSTVAAARLTGLVRNGAVTLALVETSDGIGYILQPGDTLADGRLLEIGSNMVVFGLAPKPGATTNRVVLKLASD